MSSSSFRTMDNVPLPIERKSTSVATGEVPCNINASAVSFLRRSNNACSFSECVFHSCRTRARCVSLRFSARVISFARFSTDLVWPGPAGVWFADEGPSTDANATAEEHALPSTR